MQRIVPFGLAALVLLLAANRSSAADWPHWRGPNRSDITGESSGWEDGRWVAEEPAWRANVGEGSSSPIIAEGRLYALGWRDGEDVLACLDAASGRELWKRSYAAPQYARHSEGDKGIYSGPSSTPEFDPATGRLYTLSLDGDLRCWDTRQEGREVWSLNLYDAYDVRPRPDVGRNTQRDYGYTTSPLLHGGWVIVEVGDDEGTLMAFDARTGERRWASQCRDEAGHTGGPVPMTVEGVPCVAVLTLRNLLVARLDAEHEGETLALHPWATDFANNIATPAVHENFVLVTSSYNQSAICKLRISASGAEQVWEQPLASGVCSPVIHKGHVYWAWHGIHCLDFETGEERWVGGSVGDPGSCIVTGDDRLIVLANRGTLSLHETAGRSPDKLTTLAALRSLFQTDAWPHVVLAEGRLYARDREGNIACLPVP